MDKQSHNKSEKYKFISTFSENGKEFEEIIEEAFKELIIIRPYENTKEGK